MRVASRAPVDSVPDAVLLPAQAPDAEQLSVAVALQERDALFDELMLSGLAMKVRVGAGCVTSLTTVSAPPPQPAIEIETRPTRTVSARAGRTIADIMSSLRSRLGA